MVMTPMMRTRTMRGMAKPEGASVVPIGLVVNHDGLGFGFGLHEHPPKGEREGNDRDD
jgi:hypothetical protein